MSTACSLSYPKPMNKNQPAAPKLNIRQQVYKHLRSRMRSGDISYDDRLVDHEIAAELQVSRMPVREALLQLTNEGLLEGTSRGFMLRRFTPADIAQIFEIRMLLEPEAAAAACLQANLEGLALMNKAANASEKAHAAADPMQYMIANDAFRESWISLCPNPHLSTMIFRLSDHVEAVRLATLRDTRYRELSMQATRGILQSFLDKDPEQAREHVRTNLRHASMSYYATLDEMLERQAG